MISTQQRLLCVAIFAAMTTACSSGGSSLNAGGGNTTNLPGTGATGPEFIKEKNIADSEVYKLNQESSDGSDTNEVEYGHTQPAPISGYLYYKNKDTPEFVRERKKVDPEQAQIDSAENYDTITFTNTKPREANKVGQDPTREVNINKKHWVDNGATPLSNYGSDYELKFSGDVSQETKNATSYLYTGKLEATAGTEYLKLFELKNTKIGMVSEDVGGLNYSNIFYKAKNPSELIPSSGTAEYKGLWDLVRDLPGEDADLSQTSVGYGNHKNFSAATFEVDFGNNKLTGKLDSSKSEILGKERDFAYNISADINGNRFAGTATRSNTGEGYQNDIRDATVKGGFFGTQAAELAGTIQNTNKATDATKDKPGFFGVFAAKQTDKQNLVEGQPVQPVTYNSSGVINANLNTSADKAFSADGFVQALPSTSKLPNINMIKINGTTIDLSEAIKAQDKNNTIFLNTEMLPLQFTRFGSIQGDTATDLSYFYQGQLTQVMPTDTADYEGSWIAHGLSKDGTPYTVGKDNLGKVKFNVDFGNKQLSGEFLSNSGAKAMTLSKTTFNGNSFNGVASIEGVGLSSNRTPRADGAIKGNVNISGNFFGDNANEIGGQFSKDNLSFAGVFAGKKTK